jgi:ankyrin repeat protein
MFNPCRLIFILVAGSCFLSLLGADLDAGRARIALFQPAGQEEDTTLAAALRTVADTVELSLVVMQRYEVRRLPPADPAKDLDHVRAYCQENRVDQAILGSGSARPGGGYRFRLVVYDRKTDSITTDQQGASSGALDIFDVTDALVESLLDELSGTHLLFGSLVVETDPSGATLAVDGKSVGAAPVTLHGLPVGTLKVSASSEGREEAETSATIVDGETIKVLLTLARSVGRLAVKMPADAAVSIRSSEIGEKEISGPGAAELPTGEYEMEASCPGLESVSERITIRRNETSRWLPWPKGYLAIESHPAGATVYVDQEECGAAPLVVEVEPGTLHGMELRKEKYQVYRVDLSAAVGSKISYSAELSPLPGSIRVETNPVGAAVWVDEGKPRETPCTFDGVAPGRHTVAIPDVLVHRRYYTCKRTFIVDVSPGEETTLSPTLEPAKAQLLVLRAPPSSTVSVDGVEMDPTQAFTSGVEIPAGTLDIIVTSPVHQVWRKTVTVANGFHAELGLESFESLLPRRTVKVDGKVDDWAGLWPIWELPVTADRYLDQPGTQMAKGFACRDDNYLYLRYDFADGSPRATKLSKSFPERLTYAARIYLEGKSEHIFMGINFDRTFWGAASNTNMHIWDVSTRSVRTKFGDLLFFRIGEGTLEIAVPLAPIKSYLTGGRTQVELSVINDRTHGDLISSSDTDLRTIDFGFSHGSLVVTTATEGTLYLDGKAMADVPAGANAKFDSVETGSRSLELRYADGQVEQHTAMVEAGSAASVSFAYRKAPPAPVGRAGQTTDFFELVKNGTPEGVQAAINQGADIKAKDKDGKTPLMCAAQSNPNPEVITTLLSAGAYIEARTNEGWTHIENWTPLMWAALGNQNPAVITTLLKSGADIKAKANDGRTALMLAAAYNPNPEVIMALLSAGAYIEARTNEGWTPLMRAALSNQNPAVITTLLKSGADIKARANDGRTPLMLAAAYNPNPEVIMALLKAGADAKAKDRAGKTVFDWAKGNPKLKGTDAYRQLQEASR